MAQLGCRVPNAGDLPLQPGVRWMAGVAESAGAESLWVADHVVQVRGYKSAYPYTPGKKTRRMELERPWFEALTVMSWLAAATERVRIGSAVLVLPQRDPVLVAKAMASLDQLSAGRAVLGVGAGWLAEEFTALGWDFRTRGKRMNEAIEVLRACWSGSPEFEGEFFNVPPGVVSLPVPAQPDGVPILVGGMTEVAIERAARLGDGWLALTGFDTLDLDDLAAQLRRALEIRPADLPKFHAAVYILGEIDGGSTEQLGVLRELAKLGFDEVIIEVPWPDEGAVRASIAAAIEAVA
jgi:probable F420-dependent oxidoreductase